MAVPPFNHKHNHILTSWLAPASYTESIGGTCMHSCIAYIQQIKPIEL